MSIPTVKSTKQKKWGAKSNLDNIFLSHSLTNIWKNLGLTISTYLYELPNLGLTVYLSIWLASDLVELSTECHTILNNEMSKNVLGQFNFSMKFTFLADHVSKMLKIGDNWGSRSVRAIAKVLLVLKEVHGYPYSPYTCNAFYRKREMTISAESRKCFGDR